MILNFISEINFGSEFFNAIDGMLNNIIGEFQANTMMLGSIAKKIGIMGLLILLVWTVFRPLSGNGSIDVSKIGRIFLVILGITFYSSFISIINAPLDLINNGLKAIADTSEKKNDWFFDHEISKLEKESKNNSPLIDKNNGKKIGRIIHKVISENPPPEKEASSIDAGIDYINGAFNTITKIARGATTPGTILKSLELAVTEGIYEFFILLGKISSTLLNTTRAFLLISLSILGIVVIALCAFPGLEGSFLKWLQFYITVYIWTGISHLLRYVLAELYSKIKMIAGNSDVEQIGTIVLENKFIIPVALAAIAGNAMIPKLANMLIQTGMSSVGTSMNKASKGGSNNRLNKNLSN
ncbi:hypothetical protein LNI89_11450 [Tenacibaculum dicentrarchi]|nr:hypothetical protein [Tenacibaculum dicentrarchi]MCD8421094.1 hypothetical protein [Tenacibaculum dicentrarchi]